MAASAKPGREQQSATESISRWFIFDGDCSFCRRWAAWLEHRVGSAVRFVPFQALDDLARFGLTIVDVRPTNSLDSRARARMSDACGIDDP